MNRIGMSPLRYPGGKAKLAPFLSHLLRINDIIDPIYVEPFAGGAGAAIALLVNERVSRVILNDKDYRIISFWRSALYDTDRFIRMVQTTKPTISEWKKQRRIYSEASKHSEIAVGFATFFLNRCNRSGIISNGGPIGGLAQSGKWLISARYNAASLANRIKKLSEYSNRIELFCEDGIHFMRTIKARESKGDNYIYYIDPPYWQKGKRLYYDSFTEDDHVNLSRYLSKNTSLKWVLTYDSDARVLKLYKGFPWVDFTLPYTAYHTRVGHEIMVTSRRIKLPVVRF